MKTLSTSAIALIAALGLGTGTALAEGDSGARAGGEAATNAESAATNVESIATSDPGMLKGKSVKSRTGEDVGDIDQIVRGTADQELYAVVGIGEFLGMGGKDVAIPLSELNLEGDNLVLMSQNAEENLEKRPEYKAENFRPIDSEHKGSESPSVE